MKSYVKNVPASQEAVEQAAETAKDADAKIGNLSQLTTTAKGNLVAAINEAANAVIPKYSEVTNPTVGQLAYVPGREEPGEGGEETAIILPRLLLYCEDAEGRGWYSVQLNTYEEE